LILDWQPDIVGINGASLRYTYNMRREIGMTKSVMQSGICGFTTQVVARAESGVCSLTIDSDCPTIQRLAKGLRRVDPMEEISYQGKGPLILKLTREHCLHPSCPVPAGIIKAVEVEAGLALPKDVAILVTKAVDQAS
jgi:hypothetical protein